MAIRGIVELLGFAAGKSGEPSGRPVIADSNSKASTEIAAAMLAALGVQRAVPKSENSGSRFEHAMRVHIGEELQRAGLQGTWTVGSRHITEFWQYAHLRRLQEIVDADTSHLLSAEFGQDYLVRPDVTVSRAIGDVELLHAAVSCKWTLRSDRAQNVRHEAVMMIRHRRGRLPHMAAVTLEPMPTRIASLSRGTGEIDHVYHALYDELVVAVEDVGTSSQRQALDEMVRQGRLRPLAELAPTLVSY